jgi:hypothetical protein
MMTRWRRAVPLREVPATLAALAVAVAMEIGLRVLRLPRLSRLMGAPLADDSVMTEPNQMAGPMSEGTRRRLDAVDRVMRHWPFGDTCLRHSLVTGHRLRALHPLLRVGVAKIDGVVKAHAWLEIDGRPLDPLGASQYQVISPVRSA